MNYTFKISDVEVNVSGVNVKVGGIEVTVGDLNILDSLKVMKELPGIVTELRRAIEMPLGAPILKPGEPIMEEPNDYTGRESTLKERIQNLREEQTVTFFLTADRIVHAAQIEEIEEYHFVTDSNHGGTNDGRIPFVEIVDFEIAEPSDGTIQYHLSLIFGVPQHHVTRGVGSTWNVLGADDVRCVHLHKGHGQPNSYAVRTAFIYDQDAHVFVEPRKELGHINRADAYTQYKDNARKYGYVQE